MKLKLTWLLTLFMAFVMQFSFAQEKTVTGTVTTASDGLPLPGASVIVKGTARGQQTDFDGKYTIKVTEGDVLVISYVGMDNTEVTITSANTYNVALKEGNLLDEVVVVGYGTATKQSFAGSATVVDAEKIENKNFSNVSQSLAGEAAGVTVINTSGQPGSVSTIRIRGFGSVNGNRAPLYVVDGVPLSSTASLNSINPGDIKTTTILKDATATAIYGSRGANGVILITTKSGSSTESFIEVDVRTGINTQIIPRYDVLTSPEEYMEFVYEAKLGRETLQPTNAASAANPTGYVLDRLFADPGVTSDTYINQGYNMWNAPGNQLINPATGRFNEGVTRKFTPETFQDELFGDGYRYEANVRMGGGNEKSKYFISAGFLDDNGVPVNSYFKRYNTRINVSSQIKDWLNVGANISYLYSESRNNSSLGGAENTFEFADKTPPLYPVFLRDDDGNRVIDPVLGGFEPDYGSNSSLGRTRPTSDQLNPYGAATLDYNGTERYEVVANANLNAKITEGLTFETSVGLQYSSSIGKTMNNQFYGTGTSNGGSLSQLDLTTRTLNFLQLLRYSKDFGDHSFEVLAAHESNQLEQRSLSAFKTQAILPLGLELDNYIVAPSPVSGNMIGRTLDSYFSQLNYNFDNKYYLTASVRRDGSSRFANNKWDTFFSVGAAWVISNEGFLENNDLVRYLKLKGSYGTTGDEQGVSFYSGINLFDVSNLNGGFAVTPRLIANPELTWERATQYQAGLEFTLGDFLDGSFDYFIKDTENLFFDRPNPISTGVASVLVNDGVLRNSGFEFDLTAHLVKKENFTLDATVNGIIYSNEIREMPLDPSDENRPNDFINLASYAYEEGRSIFDFYMREYAGVDPGDGFPVWYEYFDDANNNDILDDGESIQSLTPYLNDVNPDANVKRTTTKTFADATEKYVDRSGIPDLQGAFRLNATIHNFNISTQFTYQIGGYGYDFQYAELMHDNNGGILGTNRHTDVRQRWQQPGDITSVPRLADRVVPNITSQSTRFITKTDFLALNNILVGYTLPSKMLGDSGIDLLNIYVSGDNLFIASRREGFNPNTSQTGNSGRARYAPLSTLTLGLRLKF
ncbi:SusC/RagA family TonB-linked outer membrane protein [Winogradskyella sp.]|nr:SusC/RagA family TonB-linked outer membrane protein [Winogradskyella sp.]MDC1505861.1 SusC/RagA family TonB-linked outer membrane protein [Winogradskyella sp.]